MSRENWKSFCNQTGFTEVDEESHFHSSDLCIVKGLGTMHVIKFLNGL